MTALHSGDRPRPAPPAARQEVVARAPVRLDLGGGWSDVPPYADEVGGVVCNVAIRRYATVRLHQGRDDEWHAPGRREAGSRLAAAALRRAGLADVQADVWSDFPVSAGLGGSSAAGVALAAATAAWRAPISLDDARRTALAEWSRALEVEDAGIAGGRQDHYAAAFGGALCIAFGAAADGEPARATRVALADETRAALERRAVVVYTGESRVSGDTITAVLDAYARGERGVVQALARMRALATEMAAALAAGRLDEVGALLAEHWTHQRSLHRSIPTARIDEVIARAAAAGALGAKALGASGGGCVLALAAEGREGAVRAAVAPFGEIVDVAVDDAGVTVESDPS